MKTILVTGINGFVGKHLASRLHTNGYRVLGLGKDNKPSNGLEPLIDSYICCDLTNKVHIKKIPLGSLDGIVSLAGLASVGDSFTRPGLYKKVNVEVLTNLCEAMLGVNSRARIIAVSTGAVYDSSQSMPLAEKSALLNEGSPYAQSKVLMEKAAEKYIKLGLDCVIARPFNHFGPGQLPGFLVPDLYSKLSAWQKNGKEITSGSLNTKRDYTDVRDVVRAYCLLLSTPKLNHKTYNVCSGVSRSGQSVFDALSTAMNLLKSPPVVVDKSLIRPNDPLEIYGSHDLLTQNTGWEPTIKFEKTLTDFVASNN